MNKRASEQWKQVLAYDDTFQCIQCGYCLPACPTYETMQSETHSPRGRINLVKATAEGNLNSIEALANSIDKCLGCLACESACPTGVPYGKIFDSAKMLLAQHRKPKGQKRFIQGILLRLVKSNKVWQNLAASVLWLVQKSGLLTLAKRSHTWNRLLARILPPSVLAFTLVIPEVSSPVTRWKRPKVWTSAKKQKYTVAFFTGCIMDMMFEQVNRQSMSLLQQSGCEVIVLQQAGCCGALHAHAGDRETAARLARNNIIALEKLERDRKIDFVVNAAGGCGAMLQQYESLFDDPQWKKRAHYFSVKNKDISEVLKRAEPLHFAKSEQQSSETVTYQPSCHMTNVQKNVTAPLHFIRSACDNFQAMPGADRCCGSAGIYNMMEYEASMEILDRKMASVRTTNASTIITTNPGCYLQMKLGVEKHQLHDRVRVVHLSEWLAEHIQLTEHE